MRTPGQGFGVGQLDRDCPPGLIYDPDKDICFNPADPGPLVTTTAGAITVSKTAGNTLLTIAGVALGVGAAWLLWRKLR